MRTVAEKNRQALWDEVTRDFPDDALMQEVHYVRLLHGQITSGMSPAERLRFYNRCLDEHPADGALAVAEPPGQYETRRRGRRPPRRKS